MKRRGEFKIRVKSSPLNETEEKKILFECFSILFNFIEDGKLKNPKSALRKEENMLEYQKHEKFLK
ncbi:MAG: hypothetical protein ABIM42_07210 [candidate division WOR-3 bacterium]